MIVVLTERATRDLLEIEEYIEQQNPERAASFAEELLDRCYDLADTAVAFPLVPRYERYEIRRRPHGSEVIHILHGARDYLPLIFPQSD